MTNPTNNNNSGGMSVHLSCADMNTSLRYYRDVLGFELKESWPDAENPIWASLVLQGQTLMIGGAMTPETLESCKTGNLTDWHREQAGMWGKNPVGVGIQTYFQVDDIDTYHAELATRDARLQSEPTTQFYGIRDIIVTDPDGYTMIFFSPVKMDDCQSCGMPLANAEPGTMYCQYCSNASGGLRPYEEVFEGTVTGYFMAMQKMDRPTAEVAAKEHLAKMPAWACQAV
ncbi:MAG: VOC family protein [Planctomycetota bacterium]|nr:VOC family protein [Planctomycetota bacterium]MDP6838464.1 VOC family protein [Planctomycetota bacterium]